MKTASNLALFERSTSVTNFGGTEEFESGMDGRSA